MAKAEGPDQAKSWIIALAACVINTLLSGISRGTGIFYVALIDVYGISRSEANMPFTLRNSVRNLAGPVVGIIGQRYGVRMVTIVGGVLATLGIVLCTFAPNVLWISIFWGGFHGLGVAFANTLFQVTVNQYFLKYRATAAGLALSGACLGSFIFPITIEIFLNNFGLQGAFLLTGGLIMQVLPAAILLKEPSWLENARNPVKPVDNPKDKDLKLETILENHDKNRKDSVEKDDHFTLDIKNGLRKSSSCNRIGNSNNDCDKQVSNQMPSKISGIENHSFSESVSDVNEKVKEKNLDGFYSPRRMRTISASEVSITISSEQLERSAQQNRSMLKCILKVYSNPMFHMISFSLATFSLLFDPLMTVVVDYIKDKGLDDHVGKYLISVLSLGDLVGRMCFGWVTDRSYMTLPKFMMLNLVLQGISFVLFPIFYTFEALMGVVIVYGVAAGTTIVMFPILVGKYLANEQALAIGCIAFFAGIVSFSVPPLIGHFRDNAGSYDGMFYITGGMSIVAGLLWLLEPCLTKSSEGKSHPVEVSHDNR